MVQCVSTVGLESIGEERVVSPALLLTAKIASIILQNVSIVKYRCATMILLKTAEIAQLWIPTTTEQHVHSVT